MKSIEIITEPEPQPKESTGSKLKRYIKKAKEKVVKAHEAAKPYLQKTAQGIDKGMKWTNRKIDEQIAKKKINKKHHAKSSPQTKPSITPAFFGQGKSPKPKGAPSPFGSPIFGFKTTGKPSKNTEFSLFTPPKRAKPTKFLPIFSAPNLNPDVFGFDKIRFKRRRDRAIKIFVNRR